MTNPRQEQLRRLFDRALELPATARAVFLESKCSGDAELKRRIEGMLAAATGDDYPAAPAGPKPAAAGSVAGPTAAAAAAVEPPAAGHAPLREGPGTRIGPYKLLQLIGEGGFGAVFLAEQEKPVARKVALKIIKLGMDTRQVVARFEQERQALAMMEHPNIARVLDAGATETGRPYFVMDLVKGDPIAAYCDKNHLTIEERLELFAQVCHAVQHAHGKGIIHRDLKPSNILVGTQDGRPLAKVIDFGIAKATSSKLTDKTLFTEHHQVIGTLQYMSPEQAEGSLDIDTRTDVYSLGVLLYELLIGSTPFDEKTVKDAMYGELQRMILEVEPQKPSTRLNASRATLASIAAHRRVEPKRLGTIIRGELDWIVMKALEKDRQRRYETANGLAMDIGRYLRGEAVGAAPPSAVYRLRKFVRRNKGVVTAAAAVAAALLVGVVGFAWQAAVARGERDLAVRAKGAEEAARKTAQSLGESESRQRAIAETNERKAAAINQFLLDMLGSADIRKLGREARVAQALDQAALGVGTAFEDRPEVAAAVRRILGKTYASIGMLDQAGPQIQAGLELNRRHHGEASVEVAQSLSDLGYLELQRGHSEASAEACRKGFEIALQTSGPESELTLGLQADYANALVQLKREPEAEKLLREALATRTRVFGRETSDTQIMVNSLAVLLHNLERLDEAEPLYREAVATGAKVLGPEHPDTLTARMNLASILRSRGNLAESEPLMVAAYAGIKQVFGDSHTKTAAAAWTLAGLHKEQGRFKEALPFYEECVAIRRKAEGENTPGVAEAKESLAQTLHRLGESTRAAAVQREAVAVWSAIDGAEGGRTLTARLDLANYLVGADRKPEAEAMFKELLEASSRTLGEDHRTTIITSNSYGVLLLSLERYADAEPYIKTALEAGRRTEGAASRDTLITQANYTVVMRELGRLEEAESLGRDTLAGIARVFGPRHPNTASLRSNYAETLIKLGRNDDARRELVEAIAIRKGALGARNAGFTGSASILGKLLVDTGHADEAEPVLREVVEVVTESRGPKEPRAAAARLELGRCLTRLQRFAEAEPHLTEGYAILIATRPAGHKDVRRGQRGLAELYAAWNAAEPDPARAQKAEQWLAKADAER